MWITKSIEESKKLRKHYKLHDIDIFIKDDLPSDIDPNFIFLYVAKRIPSHLLKNIDIIYVGQFKNLIDKGANALYEDGAIYITNKQTNDMDMIDDLVHEIAHAAEQSYSDRIYGDGRLESEFLSKRKSLYNLIKANTKTEPPISLLHDAHYREDIEAFLYEELGYNMLNLLIVGLFSTTYSTVSVREYLARGFEEYYLGEKKDLLELSPVLYQKIEDLQSMED